jgi:hypothetical protein
MDFPGRDPFAVAGNHGLVAGCEVISPARSSADSGGESDGCCLDDFEELAEPEFRGAESPDLPIPRRSLSDFFNSASDSPPNQGREEEEQVGGDSVDVDPIEGHSPTGDGVVQIHPLQRAHPSSIQAPGHGRRGAF